MGGGRGERPLHHGLGLVHVLVARPLQAAFAMVRREALGSCAFKHVRVCTSAARVRMCKCRTRAHVHSSLAVFRIVFWTSSHGDATRDLTFERMFRAHLKRFFVHLYRHGPETEMRLPIV